VTHKKYAKFLKKPQNAKSLMC